MRFVRIALLLGILGTPALHPTLSQTEGAQVHHAGDEPAPLMGVLRYLAQQAGYELELPLAPPFLKKVTVQASGDFVEVLEGILAEHAPGYRLEGTPPRFRVVKAPVAERANDSPGGTEAEGVAGGRETPPAKAVRYLVIGADGGVAEGEMPKLPVALVVDGLLTPKEGRIDLTLSPLGPTCLYRGSEGVCFRALTPGLEGEVPVRLGGEAYTVRYRVAADAVVLYRFGLGKEALAKEPQVSPKPLVPSPKSPPGPQRAKPETSKASSSKKTPAPLKVLPPGSWWREGKEVAWMGLSLERFFGAGRWLRVGGVQKPESAASLFSRLKRLGLSPILRAEPRGAVTVLVADHAKVRQALRRAGLTFAPLR
jgi:hypothetical protein